jgi:hypothetical protein
LSSVRSIGNHLSVAIRFQGRDYVTLLEEWKPPPSVEQVLAALTAAVGRAVQQVGDVDVGNVRPRPPASTSPASNLPLLRRPGTYDPADATRRPTASARWTPSATPTSSSPG